ncbi:MAG: outer membrane beta-barrel protein [Acidobacteriota bacterium]
MKKLFGIVCLVLAGSVAVMAQEVPKVEIFGGYSWAGANFHGWNGSLAGNVTKSFAIVADFSGHYGSELDGVVRINKDAHSFLFGPKLARRGKRLTPFAYALFGATRFHESATIAGQHLSGVDTGFSMAFGGGLDVKLSDRLALRAFQLDYFRPSFFGEAHNRGRLAFGIVLRLGKK